MKKPSDDEANWEVQREKIIGLGERSLRKTYYPELQQKLDELERFRALLDQSNDCIFLVQLPSLVLVDVNASACRQLQCAREEFLALPLSRLMPPDAAARITAMASSGKTRDTIATFLYRCAGGEFPVEMTFSLVAFESTLYGAAVARDITERKQAEQALQRANQELERRVAERTAELEKSRGELERQNRELRETYRQLEMETAEHIQAVEDLREKDRLLIQQSRLAVMGEVLGNLAHHWRQPLNVLGLSVQQLGLFYDSGGFSREFLNDSIDGIMKILLHMSQTIDDFRNLFMQENGKGPFEVAPVIAKTLSLLEDNFKEQQIEIQVEAATGLQIIGYPNQYAQVLLNILMNARDALLEQGIPDKRILVRSWGEGGRAVTTITDNAGGISDRIAGRIFDAFFTTKPQGKGSGLGLFIAKMLVETNMAGRLAVRNTGSGAEFRVEV